MTTSILIPTYNKMSTIASALSAWNHQEGVPDQLVVVEDGSYTAPPSFIGQFYKHNFIYIWQPDRGYRLATAINLGLWLAEGDIIIRADDDIVPPPGFTLLVQDFYDNKKNKNKIFCPKITRLSPDGTLKPDYRTNHPTSWVDFHGGCFAATREIWENVGLIDEQYNGHWGAEDTDWAIRAVMKGYRLHLSDDPVVHLEHEKKDNWQQDRQVNVKKMLSKFGKNLPPM